MSADMAETELVGTILTKLRESEEPCSTTNLLESFESEEIDPDAVRRALWRLVNDGYAELTEDWKLRLLSKADC